MSESLEYKLNKLSIKRKERIDPEFPEMIYYKMYNDTLMSYSALYLESKSIDYLLQKDRMNIKLYVDKGFD